MTQHYGRSELALVGILGVLAVLIALTPWKKLVLQYKDYQKSKYDYSGTVSESRKPGRAKADWTIKAQYSSESGALEVNLSHKYDVPTRDIWLLAQFSPERSAAPVARTMMRHQSGGIYRSDDVRLAKGEWLMSLTGIHRDRFLFRREQVLQVD